MVLRLNAGLWLVIGLLGAAPGARAQSSEINPKIVLQTLPYGGVELAAWTPDDNYIITAGDASRTVLIWDAKTGHVIDRLALPGGASQTSTATKRLGRMVVAPDGNSVSIIEVRLNAADSRFESSVFSGNPTVNYTIDLQTRQMGVTAKGGGLSRTNSAGAELEALQQARRDAARSTVEAARNTRGALEAQVEGAGAIRADAPVELPPLPTSHDGKRSLQRTRDGLVIKQEGQPDLALKLERNLRFRDADLSPDGGSLAMLPQPVVADDAKGKTTSVIELFDTTTGQFLNPITLPGDYHEVKWAGEGAIFATGAANGELLPGALIDANDGKVLTWVKPHCYLKALADGSFYGVGLANCGKKAGKDFSIRRFDFDRKAWQSLADVGLEPGATIREIAVSPDGRLLAALVGTVEGTYRFILLDGRTGEILRQRTYPGRGAVSRILLLDENALFVSGDEGTAIWDFAEDDWRKTPLRSSQTRLVASDDNVIAAAGLGDDSIDLVDLTTGERRQGLDFGRVLTGGFIPEASLFWALSAHDGLRFWDTRQAEWVPILTTYFFADQGFVAVTPEGRYDTNLGPDTRLFRWILPDRPFQSLAPQTFMRDYFTPGLTPAIKKCSQQQDCNIAFKQLKPISALNRVLPEVKITSVEQGESPNLVRVTVAAREVEDATAPAGKTRSGLYNLRLFRDLRFADQAPNDQDLEDQEELTEWRKFNRLIDDDENPGDGVYHKTFDVFLPTAADKTRPVFTAYAFNEDRAKSETAYLDDYVRPRMTPAKPRAFVISVGIDVYNEKRLNLDYAASDARLMKGRLAKIPGFEMRHLLVTAEPTNKQRPTADAINMIFAMLAGFEREKGLEALAEAGIDGSILDVSQPDDIVIFTFSGHGWADKQRNFYMIPSDGVWLDGAEEPLPHTLVTTPEITMWLRVINAAEIVMIIDACHAGASVDTLNFKPGPMGDAGLGQLAYDKGIKILVATQADDVALESSKLQQGLLTYALAAKGEGLSEADGVLDNKTDGRISLDEWMFYPVLRLPTLNDDERVTDGNADFQSNSFRFPGRTSKVTKKVQQPTLFDYGEPSRIILGKSRK